MADEGQLHDRIARKGRAEALLRDELLAEALDGLEAEYTKRWRESTIVDAEGREQLWRAITVVGHVRRHLGLIAADGRLATAELDHLMKANERRKRFGII